MRAATLVFFMSLAFGIAATCLITYAFPGNRIAQQLLILVVFATIAPPILWALRHKHRIMFERGHAEQKETNDTH